MRGPASEDEVTLEAMVEAGMDVARIALAHTPLDEALTRHQRVRDVAARMGRTVGTLVDLENETGVSRFLFIGPASGGLVVSFDDVTVTVITPDSPLGKALLGGSVDDDVTVDVPGNATQACIANLW